MRATGISSATWSVVRVVWPCFQRSTSSSAPADSAPTRVTSLARMAHIRVQHAWPQAPQKMQLNRFDLNLLIALDALLHEKNVTRAAERVFVSQPAMSAALQKLRDYFNDPLLVRVGRDMELTPRGLSLVEPVREALLRIQATLGTQPTFDPATVKRTFTVIVTDEAAGGVVPAVLRRVAREAPGVQCHIEQVSHTSLSRIEYGDADLCLCLDILRLFGIRSLPDNLR